MNMKTMIAAFAVVAATVSSADTFKWVINPGSGSAADGVAYANWTGAGYAKNSPALVENSFSRTDYDKNGGYFTINLEGSGGDKFKFGIWSEDSDGNWVGFTHTGAKGGDYNDRFNGTIKWVDIWNATQNGGTYRIDFQGTDAGYMTLQAVPEPTSGLMLLLSAGMLALRRKHAKVA